MNARSRLLPFLLLAFALLFAQQGAALHALSHLGEPLPTQSQQDKHLPHSQACEKCVVYAGVGSAVGASALTLPSCSVVAAHLASAATAFQPQATQPYLSRAPPSLV